MRRGRGHLRVVETIALATLLGAGGVALSWLEAPGQAIESWPADADRGLVAARPALPAIGWTLPVAMQEPRESLALVTSEPRCAAGAATAGAATAGAATVGALDLVLVDTWGSAVALGPFDYFWLMATEAKEGQSRAWQVQPDASGRIHVPNLPPGRYVGMLVTGIAGSLSRSDLQVEAGEPTRVTFQHASPVLQRRIALRIVGSYGEESWPEARGILLHGPGIGRRSAEAGGRGLFTFDDVPPGRYDVEVRANATQSRWLRGVEPGTLRESIVDLGWPLEPGSPKTTTR